MESLGEIGLEFDKNWGIDGFICTADHRKLSVQSKCRRHDYLISAGIKLFPASLISLKNTAMPLARNTRPPANGFI